jgi:hypothetical protein
MEIDRDKVMQCNSAVMEMAAMLYATLSLEYRLNPCPSTVTNRIFDVRTALTNLENALLIGPYAKG